MGSLEIQVGRNLRCVQLPAQSSDRSEIRFYQGFTQSQHEARSRQETDQPPCALAPPLHQAWSHSLSSQGKISSPIILAAFLRFPPYCQCHSWVGDPNRRKYLGRVWQALSRRDSPSPPLVLEAVSCSHQPPGINHHPCELTTQPGPHLPARPPSQTVMS